MAEDVSSTPDSSCSAKALRNLSDTAIVADKKRGWTVASRGAKVPTNALESRQCGIFQQEISEGCGGMAE